jgi:CBS domain-containing protein
MDIQGKIIQEFMTYSPHTVFPGDSVASCVGAFLMAKSRHLPVVDEEDHLIGMLSIKDVFENLSLLLQETLLED